MYVQNTMSPYKVLDYKGIDYTTCKDFPTLSRYRGLRQVIREPEDAERYMTLENANAFSTNNENVIWHTVTITEENRLDLLASKYLGSAQYAWVIAYYNNILDGFSCYEGQKLQIPKSITDLMKSGEILQSVPALHLNLGSE